MYDEGDTSMTREIDYGNLMHQAMRGLIKTVLEGVAEHGLPGAHHFFITFDTEHEDVDIADWLRERYPSEMTVVMQHWYENLDVGTDGRPTRDVEDVDVECRDDRVARQGVLVRVQNGPAGGGLEERELRDCALVVSMCRDAP